MIAVSPPRRTRASRVVLAVIAAALLLVGTLSPASARAEPAEEAQPPITASDHVFDVVVYGGTPSAVMAAVAAARSGARVALIEPTAHVGGMMSNGLSWTDRGDTGAIGGLAREFFDRVQAIEGSTYGRYAFQPRTAETVFGAMLAEAGVVLFPGQRLAEAGRMVLKTGARIASIAMESGITFAAAQFVDASYEGDLMARAGVSYRIGREAIDEYGESMAGVKTAKVLMTVPAGMDPGFPVSAPGPVGSADGRIQASNYRVCLSTDPANQVPFPIPAGYDPARYDIVVEYMNQLLAAGLQPELHWVFHVDRLVRSKWDLNEYGAMTMGIPGANYDYPDGSYARRQEIEIYHRTYQQGFLHFLATDPRVPAALQAEVNRFGLCADEFTDNGAWPRQLYLREGRRMIGQYVLSQHDVNPLRSKRDIIGIASYRLDSHLVSRWIDGEGRMLFEGGYLTGASARWAIPYRSLTPPRGQATNLLVSATVSATHVAYSSLRMEPQYMIMGQAAGTAAALAAAAGVDVQDVSTSELQSRLRAAGAVLDDPGDIGTSTFHDHIVWAYWEGIIETCGTALFCPRVAVSRAMMADFLARALDLPPASDDYFADDDGSPSEDNINRVAEAGITFGCRPTSFCPAGSVTRAQMASFLVRAYALPDARRDHFTDDSAFTSHEDDINSLAAAGITTGCTPTTYCPRNPVTRGEMMAFLHRATLWIGP